MGRPHLRPLTSRQDCCCPIFTHFLQIGSNTLNIFNFLIILVVSFCTLCWYPNWELTVLCISSPSSSLRWTRRSPMILFSDAWFLFYHPSNSGPTILTDSSEVPPSPLEKMDSIACVMVSFSLPTPGQELHLNKIIIMVINMTRTVLS